MQSNHITNYPKTVLAARNEANAKGCDFPDNYVLPYHVKLDLARGKEVWEISFENEEEAQFFIKNSPRFIYCVCFCGDRFSGFFCDEFKAKEFCKTLNIRHFQMAALSQDKNKPVLL